MGSLIRHVTALSLIGYGVNIYEQTPAGRVSGVKTTTIGVVADLPWGPQNEVTTITSAKELFDTFCPAAFDSAADYVALRAFMGLTFPGPVKIVRIAPSTVAAVKALHSYTVAGGTVVATALYHGAIGNLIAVDWDAATDADAAKRNVVITIGTTYSATYENVTLTSVTAIDDPYVVFTKGTAPSALPAADTATLLTSGADGTAAAADYVGSSSSSVGIRKFYAEINKTAALFVAECPTALIGTVNTGLEAFAVDTDHGMAILCTPQTTTATTAIADVASYRDDRIIYPWPRIKTTDLYAATLPEITCDGNADVACAVASVDPEVSPGGAPGAPYLRRITGLETDDATITTYDLLRAAGISPFQIVEGLGTILRGCVTTSITSGLTEVFRRRMTDYIVDSLASRWSYFVGLPLDIELATQTMGDNTAGLIGETQQFLSGLAPKRIARYAVDQYSQSAQADIDAGTWIIAISVKLWSAMNEIVLVGNIGEGVTFTEV